VEAVFRTAKITLGTVKGAKEAKWGLKNTGKKIQLNIWEKRALRVRSGGNNHERDAKGEKRRDMGSARTEK